MDNNRSLYRIKCKAYNLIISVLDSTTNIISKCFKLLPIKRNIVFECESDYADNPRAFYNYLKDHTDYFSRNKAVWIVKNVDYCKTHFASNNTIFLSRECSSRIDKLRLNYYLSVSKWFVFSHLYWFKNWRNGQIVINTRHSIFQLKDGKARIHYKLCDYVLASNEYTANKLYPYTLNIESKNVLLFGIPRVDSLYEKANYINRIIPDYNGESVILSMSTFRQSTARNDSSFIDSFAINVVRTVEQLIELDAFLREKKAKLIIKIHHLQDMSFIKVTNLENIIYITDSDLFVADIQVNELLTNADALLTDYSSVYYDYLIVDKPIGFLLYDFEQYSRGFMVEKPTEFMPGEKIYSFDQLIEFISCTLNHVDNYVDDRKCLRNKVFKYLDNKNCERLYEWLIENNK